MLRLYLEDEQSAEHTVHPLQSNEQETIYEPEEVCQAVFL